MSAFIFKKSATLSVAKQIFIGRINRASQGVSSDGNHRERCWTRSQFLIQEDARGGVPTSYARTPTPALAPLQEPAVFPAPRPKLFPLQTLPLLSGVRGFSLPYAHLAPAVPSHKSPNGSVRSSDLFPKSGQLLVISK